MNAPEHSLLLCTNGAPEGRPALDYGIWLAGQLQLPVTLLGIVEHAAQSAVVVQVLHAAQAQLDASGIPHTTLHREGRVRNVVRAEAKSEQHVVVIGPLGRPQWRRWLQGSAFRRMMPGLQAPLIYAPTAQHQLRRILICTGALDYAVSAECWALYLARRVGAALTILHIAEAVHYHYPTADKMETHWKDLLQTDIPQARHLRELLEQVQAQHIEATLHVRHGTVVREIVAEVRQGQHDLVVMGSKHSSQSLRSQYLPDVTANVMESLEVPVLAVVSGQECKLAV